MAVDPNIQKKANDIRTKTYGKEVRESLASGLEEMSKDVEETKDRQTNVEQQFQAVIDETTGKDVISAPEIIAARVSATGEQSSNLKERLDKEYDKVTSQLAHTTNELATKAPQYELDAAVSQINNRPTYNEVETLISRLGNMSPRGGFPTLIALQAAYPTGAEGIYLVTADNHWYYWNGSAWVDGGLYQATPWAEFMTTDGASWEVN